MEKYFGESTPKLGFGLMRLPKKDGGYDVEQVEKMIDLFIAAGFTYFDTAYVYDDGNSERIVKAALVDRYPRESFTLATKLCSWMGAKNKEIAEQQFCTSLERTGAGYFDYYLLHAVQNGNYESYDKSDLWNFVRGQKEKGLVRHWGFSFHGTPELLDELLTANPDVDFVQLQLNYADWEDPIVASRKNYEIARRHGKSIVVMEPVKGGTLAVPPATVQTILHDADPDASFASWAIRYAASLDGVITVLSGMSNMDQMNDNLSYMQNFKPLNADELNTILKAQNALAAVDSIPCTACHYCTSGCPKKIAIPEIFAAYNRQSVWSQPERAARMYAQAIKDGGSAGDCISCGQCEAVCPQQINVISRLKDCSKKFDTK